MSLKSIELPPKPAEATIEVAEEHARGPPLGSLALILRPPLTQSR
jgi:hypothetical protein